MMRRLLFYLNFSLTGLLLAGCAGHENYFQPDARVGGAPGNSPDSALVTVGRHYASHGQVYRWFFGDHYRALWAAPVVLPVLHLAKLPGHPHPTALGGGFQTTSVTLETADGRKFVARTLDKDPYKTLPKIMRKTFLLRVVRDETCGANPFAPLALPALSRAVGVPYASPHFYYIAAPDSTFDALTPKLRGKVVLVEEKFEGKMMARNFRELKEAGTVPRYTPAAQFEDFVATEDALRNRYRSRDYQLAAGAFARARLFDLLIGDWDRHEGQWTWAEAATTSDGNDGYFAKTRYAPIPKDRDQAFFRFDDGLLTWLASRRWAVRKLQTMHARYGDIGSLAWNARFLDARALQSLNAGAFTALARAMQANLPDSVLRAALKAWPAPVQTLETERTFQLLRARRDALPAAAEAFARHLARDPLAVGSDDADSIVVYRQQNGETTVVMRFMKADSARFGDAYFYRTYSPADTRRLRIYGLGGQDCITIVDSTAARSPHPVPIALYPGEGEDQLTLHGKSARGIRLYDTKRGIGLPEKKVRGLKVKLARRGDVRVHAFDREGL